MHLLSILTYVLNLGDILKVYIFVKHFPSYSHSSDCRHNIVIIWNDFIKGIVRFHLMAKVFSSVNGHLWLFITNLSPYLIHRPLTSNKVSLWKSHATNWLRCWATGSAIRKLSNTYKCGDGRRQRAGD